MKVYITRWALTKGIMEEEAEISPVAPTMVTVNGAHSGYSYYAHKPYWHLTRAEAVAHANQMLKVKLESLKRSLRKFEAMEFE